MPDNIPWQNADDTDFESEISKGRLHQKGQPARTVQVAELESKPGMFYALRVKDTLVALDINDDGSLSLSVEFFDSLDVYRVDLRDTQGKRVVPKGANRMSLENVDAD